MAPDDAPTPPTELGSAQGPYPIESVLRAGWTRADVRTGRDVPPGGWNGAETTVSGIRRIPVEGLRTGNLDANEIAASLEHAAAPFPGTGPDGAAARGRAIVLVPRELRGEGPLDVLLHLHGHNIGYRRPQSGAPPRDIDVERIEEQLADFGAGSRRLIAVLPQGTHRSGFGALSCDAYLSELREGLVRLGVLPDAAVRSVLLSAHSGGGGVLAPMLTSHGDRPSRLGALLLFDSINVRSGQPPSSSNELRALELWICEELGHELEALTDATRAGNTAEQERFLASSMRLVGFHTPGHYANLYAPLAAKISRWFDDHRASTRAMIAENVFERWAAHYRILPVASLLAAGETAEHDSILGRGDLLLQALRFIDGVPSALAPGEPAAGTAPA